MTKILVVDDTADMAWLMKRAMEDQGYGALIALSGRQALEMASSEHPDVLLLDIMMPGMDGVEVLRTLKANDQVRDIPVILVTAREEDEDLVAGLDARTRLRHQAVQTGDPGYPSAFRGAHQGKPR